VSALCSSAQYRPSHLNAVTLQGCCTLDGSDEEGWQGPTRLSGSMAAGTCLDELACFASGDIGSPVW
jgi:hypothetical protein